MLILTSQWPNDSKIGLYARAVNGSLAVQTLELQAKDNEG